MEKNWARPTQYESSLDKLRQVDLEDQPISAKERVVFGQIRQPAEDAGWDVVVEENEKEDNLW